MIALVWGLLLAAVAEAAPAPLVESAETIRRIVRSPNPAAGPLDLAVAELARHIEELSAPVPDDLWVEVLLDLTIARYQLDRDWQAPRLAAAWSRPDRAVPVGPSLADLRDWTAPDPDGVALPWGREVWLDGRLRTHLPPLDGLHLVQGTRCDQWTSRLVEGASAHQLRQTWLAPCPADPWRATDTALVATGVTLTVTGLALAATSFAVALARAPADEVDPSLSVDARQTLRALNATGWVMAPAGLGVTLTGALRRRAHVKRRRERP